MRPEVARAYVGIALLLFIFMLSIADTIRKTLLNMSLVMPFLFQAVYMTALVYAVAAVTRSVLMGRQSKHMQLSTSSPPNLGDYYSLLGVGKNASEEEIKRAYRSLVKKYHPDVSGHPLAEQITKKLNDAYRVLTNPAERRKYDETLQTGAKASETSLEVCHAGLGISSGFSLFSIAAVLTLFIGVISFLPQRYAEAGRPPPNGWLSPEALLTIPLLTASFFIASRTVFKLLMMLFVVFVAPLVVLNMVLYAGWIMATGTAPSFPFIPLEFISSVTTFLTRLVVWFLKASNLPLVMISANAVAALAMFWDKRQARLGGWRIPEATLRRIAVMGGGMAAVTAAYILNHKTRKTGFMLTLFVAALLNILVYGMALA